MLIIINVGNDGAIKKKTWRIDSYRKVELNKTLSNTNFI